MVWRVGRVSSETAKAPDSRCVVRGQCPRPDATARALTVPLKALDILLHSCAHWATFPEPRALGKRAEFSLPEITGKYVQLRIRVHRSSINNTEKPRQEQQVCMRWLLHYFAFGPLFENLHIDSVCTQKPPNIDVFRLAIATQTTDSLCLASIIDLLRCGEEGGQEDGVVSDGQVCTAGALVHDVEKEDASVVPILVRLKGLGSRCRRSFDLEIIDFLRLQRGSDLLHQVRELNEDQDSFIGRDLLPVSGQYDEENKRVR